MELVQRSLSASELLTSRWLCTTSDHVKTALTVRQCVRVDAVGMLLILIRLGNHSSKQHLEEKSIGEVFDYLEDTVRRIAQYMSGNLD